MSPPTQLSHRLLGVNHHHDSIDDLIVQPASCAQTAELSDRYLRLKSEAKGVVGFKVV